MRAIDADALWMDIIRSMDYCEDILEIIEKQPTVDRVNVTLDEEKINRTIEQQMRAIERRMRAKERKKGKWQRVSLEKYTHSSDYVFRCDQCGEVFIGAWNFCANCGADMRPKGE